MLTILNRCYGIISYSVSEFAIGMSTNVSTHTPSANKWYRDIPRVNVIPYYLNPSFDQWKKATLFKLEGQIPITIASDLV